jgi:Na+-driven multidrug efflux pump
VSFGDYTLAAFAIGNRISSLIMMPAMGIGKALSPIVGQNLGADQIERAKKRIRESAFLTTIVLVIGGILLLLASRWSVNQFTNDAIVIEQGLYYLRLITISLPLMGYFQILIGIFLGSGHTKSAMVIMAGRLWALRIPLIIGFRELTTLGHRGVWYSMILSNFIIVIVGYMIYKTGKWENKIVKDKIKKRAIQ